MTECSRERISIVDHAVLTENRKELVNQLEPTNIINSLFQRQVIDSDDFSEIELEERQHGRRAGVEKLLYGIFHSGPDGLDKFIDSLESSGYPGLATRLQESRQIITNRREKPRKPRFEGNNYINISEIIEKGSAAESTTNDTGCIILLRKNGIGKKQEEAEEIQKYKNIPDELDIDSVSIEKKEKGSKDIKILDDGANVDSEQRRLGLTHPDGNSSPKQLKEITENAAAIDPTTNDTRHIILLGKSGVGKSFLGNYLLEVPRWFDKRKTKECHIERKDHMVVVDTPGFFSRFRSNADVAREIMNTIRENNLLINVYILVLSVEERLSGDEIESVEFIKKLFGENVINNMIIVFTGKYFQEDEEDFQFPRCLPQLPYFIIDCKHGKQEDARKIQKEIVSQKYKNIPDVIHEDHVDWDTIERGQKSYEDYVQISSVIQKHVHSICKEITDEANATRRIILFGKSGVGKSSLGNYLLGCQKFRTSLIINGRTKVCQIEFKDHMVLVDTPGFFSSFRSDVKVAIEIMNTILLNDLSINVYILVLSANEIESGDAIESIEFINKLFGENVINNMIIVVNGVFDHGDEELQFLRCLPQLPYFMLDCKHGKQEELEPIRKEIFSQKYINVPDVIDVYHVDWASIEREDRRRKESKILDVDDFMDSVQIRLRLTQTDGNSRLKQKKPPVKEITEKGAAVEPTTNDTRCIILLGKIGVVKRSFGNSLLGAKKFGKGIYGAEIFDIVRTDQMVVMNTPGFLPNLQSEEGNAKEILNTIRVNKLLINVYILVLSVEERLSGEQLESVEFIKKLFGENVINNMIIVFTGKDLLKDDKYQFLRCLPQIPLFILDLKHEKQEDAKKIRKEIFSQKYKIIPDVFDVDQIEGENVERRRKDKCVLS